MLSQENRKRAATGILAHWRAYSDGEMPRQTGSRNGDTKTYSCLPTSTETKMENSLDEQAQIVMYESMRLLHMANYRASLAQMREVLTAGPEGKLLQICLAYVKREWPGETQTAGILGVFHALPPAELTALRAILTEMCATSRHRPSEDLPD